MNDHAKELRRFASVLGKPTIMLDAADEIERLAAKLEAAEKERDILRDRLALESQENGALRDSVDRACEERDALRARIARMEKQEPAGMLHDDGYFVWRKGCPYKSEYARGKMMLYALPGAQPAPSVPDGWLRAIDEALIVAHIGIANAHDTYEQAKSKLDNLIGFHVDVATDPAVNGGYKLMPIEPTKEIYECFAAYDGSSYSNPFDFDNFRVDYGFALEAAPEVKS